MKKWSKLDNAGKFYAFSNQNKIPAVFRYSVTLTKDIDESILQIALDETLKVFPIFNCHLRRGLFWYYLEDSNSKVKVYKENTEICAKIYRDENDALIRVNYYKRRINFEISHILSDGRGSLIFFKNLVYKYLIIKEHIKDLNDDTNSSVYEKEEDSFDKYYIKEKYNVPKKRNIYQYRGRKKNKITYFEYHLSANKVLTLAHEYKVSLTSLLIAVLIVSFHKQMKKREYNKIIRIDVPVDLRPYYKSDTSRNFFGLTYVTYKFNDDNWQFEKIVKSIDEQLKNNTKLEQLSPRINRMVSLEKNIFIRIAPLFIKDVILKIVDVISSGRCTSCVSNIGAIKMDEKVTKYIKDFNVLNASGTLKLTICSFQDDLSIGISSKYASNDIIKDFCRFFADKNINGLINMNEVDEDEKM